MKKKIFLLVLFICLGTLLFAEHIQESNIRYRLYPTLHDSFFLKLDTVTGKIWQISVLESNGKDLKSERVFSDTDIPEILKLDKVVGRYTLYTTQDKSGNFILLDQIDGYAYKGHWEYFDIKKWSIATIPAI